MPFLLILGSALVNVLVGPSSAPFDVSQVKIGAPAAVFELDLGKLKGGELRQICWSPDGKQLYIQTADDGSVLAKLHHYVVPVTGGQPSGVDFAPPWAAEYWNTKSYKSAPGIDALEIQVKSGRDKDESHLPKEGVYDADHAGVLLGATNPTMAQNISTGVIRLMLLDAMVGEFVDTRPVPGLTFGWGPERSGAIAYVDHDGHLMLMDQQKHRTAVTGTKDATLPAWSVDGGQIAWAQKTARKKYALMVAQVSR